MKKLKESITKDLWVVLLDLVAVNLSYYLAFYFRFYVNLKLGLENAEKYRSAFLGFAPFYSVLALVIFAAWKLYGGLWRYAGVNDMNRIIGANVCTVVVHVAGTAAFFIRMPISYYAVGGVLQFVFVTIIRFSYRILLVEKKRLRNRGLTRTKTIVIGSGESGRRVVKTLEDSEAYQPVAVIGAAPGTMDGVPITSLDQVNWTDIGAVFIADPLLSTVQRREIKQMAEKVGAELHDYTGYFSNLGGRLSVTEFLALIHTPLIISINGVETEYENGEKALSSITGKYDVTSIEADKITIILDPQQKMDNSEVLAQAYAAVMGGEPPQ